MWHFNYQQIEFMTIQKWAFSCMGIDIEAPEGCPIVQRRVWLMLQLLGILMWAISLCYFMIINISDVDVAVESLVFLMPCLITLSKILPVLCRRRQLVRLIRDLKDITMLANYEERKVLNEEHERSKLIARLYLWVVELTGIWFLFMPIVASALNYARTAQWEFTLPVKTLLVRFTTIAPGVIETSLICNYFIYLTRASFPFDAATPLGFLLCYGWTVFYVIAGLNVYVGVDLLFILYVQSISALFRIVRLKLAHVARDLDERDWLTFQRRIGTVIAYHCRTIALTHEFNVVFQEIILAEFMLNRFQLCFCVYRFLSRGLKLTEMLLLVLGISTASLKLLMYGFGGEKVQNESSKICDDIYLLFPFERMSPKMKRIVLIMLMRAQKTSSVTGFFFVVNCELLLWFFNTTSSYTALLFAVKEQRAELK